jgi:hypothetical protein
MGKEKPFKDENLIDEIVVLTYPEVRDFFTTHVEGTTPINYNEYLSKVGLIEGETESQLPGVIFTDATTPIFTPQDIEEKGKFSCHYWLEFYFGSNGSSIRRCFYWLRRTNVSRN